MSGGAYDYAYARVQNMVEEMREREDIDGNKIPLTPIRELFVEHLELVAKAMRIIEWVDSGDYSPGEEYLEIAEVFSHGFNSVVTGNILPPTTTNKEAGE